MLLPRGAVVLFMRVRYIPESNRERADLVKHNKAKEDLTIALMRDRYSILLEGFLEFMAKYGIIFI